MHTHILTVSGLRQVQVEIDSEKGFTYDFRKEKLQPSFEAVGAQNA